MIHTELGTEGNIELESRKAPRTRETVSMFSESDYDILGETFVEESKAS